MTKAKMSIVMILSLMICLFLSSGFASATESDSGTNLSLALPNFLDSSIDKDNFKQTKPIMVRSYGDPLPL